MLGVFALGRGRIGLTGPTFHLTGLMYGSTDDYVRITCHDFGRLRCTTGAITMETRSQATVVSRICHLYW